MPIGLNDPIHLKGYITFSNLKNSEFSSQLEATLNNLLEEYEYTMRNDVRRDYGTFLTENNLL